MTWLVWIVIGGALTALGIWLWSRRGSSILKASVELVRSWSARRRAELDAQLGMAQSAADGAAKDVAHLDQQFDIAKSNLNQGADLEGLGDEELASRFNKLPKSDR